MAQNNGGRSFPAPKWDVWSLKKLRLFGKPWNESDRRQAPALSLHVVNGNPRFRLYLNKGGAGSAIPVAFDPHIFSHVLEALRMAAEDKESKKITMNIKASYDRNIKLDKPTVVSRVTMGRDANKVVYLSIQVKGEAPAVFEFLPNFFAELIGGDGETLNPETASTICAKGYVNLMYSMIGPFLVVHATDPDAGKEKQGGGNGGYNNNGGGNGGGYNKGGNGGGFGKSDTSGFDDISDEIPF